MDFGKGNPREWINLGIDLKEAWKRNSEMKITGEDEQNETGTEKCSYFGGFKSC